MKETTWTPASIAIGERADKMLALVLADPIELTSIPMHRRDAHLVKAAALTPEEITRLEEPLDETVLL